eukprot:TRINITY_DN9517_c0_g1_i8.p1 TRINITY_DN9517_c0_g1~~TRINITY_DN9517_c0_g1_i8.p1  ORF type:complete len:134 (+),score=2.21 TRINITY_DN9517_c0_g1_i8:76-477(+)
MAPEVMWNRSHGMAVDYFALGVVAYELMMRVRPYEGMNRKDCQGAVLAKEINLTRANTPEGWSSAAADFINKCLHRKPANRLGANGPDEVRQHIWLRDVNWAEIEARKRLSPLLINVYQHCNDREEKLRSAHQ